MAYKILFFLKDGVYNLKEIGEKLKDTRENTGISIEEAAEDLKVLPSQIEAIEAGEMDKFKDVFSVKYFIRDYAKYLGLSYSDMVDEFNEYLFDYTSKLSIDDIKKAKKKEVKEEPKILSPYTLEPKQPRRIPTFVFVILFALLSIVVIYFVVDIVKENNEKDDQLIAFLD
ncbi:MAG: hypothetical protein E7169_00045 [Firmicutes bacterium]|nr:hypothetical protein [Bacillota bacterium]